MLTRLTTVCHVGAYVVGVALAAAFVVAAALLAGVYAIAVAASGPVRPRVASGRAEDTRDLRWDLRMRRPKPAA